MEGHVRRRAEASCGSGSACLTSAIGVRLGLRPLLVRGARTMLIDAGIGRKAVLPGSRISTASKGGWSLDSSTLTEAGVKPAEIEDRDWPLHLHFDHAGGFTSIVCGIGCSRRFRARSTSVRRGEWDDAIAPNDRNRASYLPENYRPLADAGVLQL